MPPLAPMLAKAAATVPPQPESGDPTWSYEPKWDGFRAIIFRDGDEVVLGSRGGKDLARYFPEAVEAVKSELPEKCVVDGELVVPREIDGVTRLSWEALSERIHPAASRVALLSEQTPAQFVGFDLLALGDRDVSIEDFGVRRALLLDCIGGGPSCHVTAATADSAEAMAWFETFEGAGLDGVVAKKLAGPYLPNKREMIKVKHARTADVVLLGYRPHKSQPGIGSMLLGLYDGSELKMVGGGFCFHRGAADRVVGRTRTSAARGRRCGRRRGQSVEIGRRPLVDSASSGAGAGSGIRPDGRGTLSARCTIPALASGQGARRMHIRSVGGSGAIRLRGCSCRR